MTNASQRKNMLTLKYPASWWNNMWREALPSGNGIIGAAVYGAVKTESILITHEDLWHWGKKDTLPDVSYSLQETRRLMDEGRFQDANWLLTNSLKENGYDSKLSSRFPVAVLKLNMNCEHAFKQYSRSLNMENGEVEVKWKDGKSLVSRKLFVSRADHAIVYELTSNGKSLQGEIELALHSTDEASLEDACHEMADGVQMKANNGFLYYAARNDDGTDYGAVARIIQREGSLDEEQNRRISFQGASSVLVIVKVFVKGEYEKEWLRLSDELSHMFTEEYNELLARHAALHGQLFHRVDLELEGTREHNRSNEELLLDAYDGEASAELMRKMWAYGRYLFISGTHTKGNPFGLYGLWGGDYELIWNHNMANENVQMMYWHAPVGGLTELMPALFQYYDSMMEDFSDNATKLFGCRGIYMPAGTTPGIGVPNQIVPVIMNWTGAAAWLANHYYEYYQFTGDRVMLTDKILPFMKKTVQFYEDFLVISEEGYFKLYPSVSPENSPGNFMPKDDKPLEHPMPTTINATMEFALLKEVLTHLIEGCRETGLYMDKIVKWQQMLLKIPDYQVNEDGAIREWMDERFDDHYNHRHLSHIYPIFPGKECSIEEQPELFKQFEAAVHKRLIGAQSGWSLVHMAAIYARLGDGNKALECLDILARSCLLNNFMTLHNDWRNMGICLNMPEAPIQLDANMGWVNAMQEMLLYVSPHIVKVLPALPDRWGSGSVKQMHVCNGRLSFSWNKKKGIFQAELSAEREAKFILRLPQGFNPFQLTGLYVSFSPHTLGEGYYEIKMKDNGKLIITTV